MLEKKCAKCQKKAIWTDYTQINLCATHLEETLEKRIRKHMRINKLINPKETYHIEKNPENKHELTKYFLKKIFSNRLNISNEESKNKISSQTLDDEAQTLLNTFLYDECKNQPKINPLGVITDDEAITISNAIGIKLNINPKKQEELTKQDPQLLFSMHKSKKFIEQRQKTQK